MAQEAKWHPSALDAGANAYVQWLEENPDSWSDRDLIAVVVDAVIRTQNLVLGAADPQSSCTGRLSAQSAPQSA